MNTKIREFSTSIIDFINKSDLPIEVKRLAIVEILSQLDREADRVIRKELNERSKENAEGV